MVELWMGDRCLVHNKPEVISAKKRNLDNLVQYQFIPDYEEPTNTWYCAEDVKPEERAIAIEDLLVYRQLIGQGVEAAIARQQCQQFLDNP